MISYLKTPGNSGAQGESGRIMMVKLIGRAMKTGVVAELGCGDARAKGGPGGSSACLLVSHYVLCRSSVTRQTSVPLRSNLRPKGVFNPMLCPG